MAENTSSNQNDSRQHAGKVKAMLQEAATQLRRDIGHVSDPKAQALFETSAEVLLGLVKAFDDFENRSEAAWR